MLAVVLVFIGGGVGSVMRYAVAQWLTPSEWEREGPSFPVATLLVNLVGCVLIGLLAGWCGRREWARSLIMVGMLGGFTTFSAFGLDAARLFTSDQSAKSLAYIALSVGCGVVGAWLAFRLVAPQPEV